MSHTYCDWTIKLGTNHLVIRSDIQAEVESTYVISDVIGSDSAHSVVFSSQRKELILKLFRLLWVCTFTKRNESHFLYLHKSSPTSCLYY